MPKGGHNRVPKREKIIRGTFRNDRNPGKEPKPTPVIEVPKPPSNLNTYARKVWTVLAAELVKKKILTVLDLQSLEACCVSYGLYKEAYEAVFHTWEKDPKTGKLKKRKRTLAEYLAGKNSQTIPELTAMNRSLEKFKSFMTEFGLSPVSRNRIEIPDEGEEEDPMEGLWNEA